MQKVKVLFATQFTAEHLMALPSNFSYYIKEMVNSDDFEVSFISPNKYKGSALVRFLRISKDIRRINPDVLYLTLWMGYNNLVLMKILGLIHCKIVIWKYTYCIDSKNILKHLFYKYVYWRSIDRIYMMFDNHTHDAVTKRLIPEKKIITLSRGADVEWYSNFLKKEKDDFRLIATGKDHRDYMTLGKACEETETQCEILTFKHETCMKAAEYFKKSKYVHFNFIEDGYNVENYKYVVDEVSKASAMAICCEKLEYGAGYTNIVECLAFRMPIIQTLNPDVHLDPEKEGIGFSVLPYDVKGWVSKINLLKNKSARERIQQNVQRLLDGEYNSSYTSSYIMNDFIKLTHK